MSKKFYLIVGLFIVGLIPLSRAQNNDVDVLSPETIVYDWEFNVISDGTVLTAWNGPGENGGIATYFNVHNEKGQCNLDEGAMLVDELESKLYTTAKQLTLLDRDDNTIVVYQTLDNAVNDGMDTNVNENYRLYKISPDGEMLWGDDGIDLNRGGYSETTQGCLSMVQIEDGSYYIAWVEYTWNNDYEIGTIHLERVSEDGEMLWNEPIILGDGITPMTFPYLVNAGNNQVIMVYAKGSGQELHAKKLDFDGTEVWSEDTRIYRNGFGSIPIWTFLKVQSDEEGGVFVGWYDDRLGTNYERTYLAHILNDGSHGFVSGEGGETVGYTDTLRSFSPSIYYDKENRYVYVLRRETSLGQAYSRMVLQKMSMQGELLWDIEGVEVYPYSETNLGYESITDDGEGNIAIFFMRNDKTYGSDNVTNFFMKVDKEDGSLIFDEPIAFSPSTGNRANLKISKIVNDEYWITMWEDYRILPADNTNVDVTELPRRLYMQRISKNGTVGFDSHNVSTIAENKKILIEEFTGIKCGNCPDGHAMAKQIQLAKDDEVFIIAIHAGHFSEPSPDQPDFRAEDGVTIHDFYEANSYPSGMVNRREYYDNIVVGRSSWVMIAKETNTEIAPVNLWINCEYDDFFEELTVNIEGYWTDHSPSDAPMLSVALLQNNIQGYQAGSGIGDEYMHQHVLRDYLSDALGDEITEHAKGDFFTKTYKYTLPEDYNGVVVVPEQLEIVAFVTENESNILNVTGQKLTHPEFYLPVNAEISEPKIPINKNYFYSFVELYLENKSTEIITEATFDVELNGLTEEVEWTGEVPALSMKQIAIPVDWTTTQIEENEWSVTLASINGEEYEGNKIKGSFNKPTLVTDNVKIKIKSDSYADDNRFMLKDKDGNVVEEFEGFVNGEAKELEFELSLDQGEIYCFEVTDVWGDGITSPRGHVKIYSDEGNLLTQNMEVKDFGWRVFLEVEEGENIDEISNDEIKITYINDCIIIDESRDFKVSIYDMSGRCVIKAVNVNIINMADFSKGIYLVNVMTSESNKTFKLIK